ncbi:hypothetical protein CDAR_420221 [Caerostris darwini]|uniref:Uncharacterized protein n=1 Tax=Caerostris darwini TaxID=1538125 RepID=A0AAV4TSS0_9ARAC|nr:hypothetical protein CDAR_420221 [Caerostris darwini]
MGFSFRVVVGKKPRFTDFLRRREIIFTNITVFYYWQLCMYFKLKRKQKESEFDTEENRLLGGKRNCNVSLIPNTSKFQAHSFRLFALQCHPGLPEEFALAFLQWHFFNCIWN